VKYFKDFQTVYMLGYQELEAMMPYSLWCKDNKEWVATKRFKHTWQKYSLKRTALYCQCL